jgi:putrescine transport system permease protein
LAAGLLPRALRDRAAHGVLACRDGTAALCAAFRGFFANFAAIGEFLAQLDLENFRLLGDDALYWQSYLYSLRIAGLTTLLALGDRLSAGLCDGVRSRRWQGALLVLVILPFWTSFLIRVYAWIGILRPDGLLDAALIGLGLTQEPLGC